MKLQNRVAVVTGAASGMGKAIAILYAKEGAKVVVSDLNDEGAKKTVDEIEANGGIARTAVANVAKEDDVQNMINAAVDTYGTLDILVNNAGIMDNMMPAVELTDDLWEKVLSVNTTGLMRATRKALSIFLEKESGVIVNMASSAGIAGSRAGAAYTASKHAVVGYTKNVGFQYAEKGIRCNAIAPGGVNTNIATTMANPDEFGAARAMSGSNNNPRNGEPEEVAKIALFLASDDSEFVNAEVIRADAGWLAY
ncbi:NAD(P)-dependent dehydrogenase, short-chain alcohol dehydrogenase family [Lentibacillus halodurans]|uniref:NAD(P)-dependent dehydrogenase, short-chain alcohol dehydrogenase family n=1 Tax=Lentibacillus halodurans TaxID=237679 RepID=A0A1I0ZRZ5_9BACI|nr:SDR family oxidoreductase [Lentibacillus halodurans]SFB28281.1 NAD(P)-dependent dehydrogenase, short-chain alcohol dehydrogenase family [Lentibacillus halodurans]